MSPMPEFNEQQAISTNNISELMNEKTETNFELVDDTNKIIPNNTDLLFDEIVVDENQCNTNNECTKSPTLSGLTAGKRLDKNSLPRDSSVDTLTGEKKREI